MYRFLIAKNVRKDYKTLYQYLTAVDEETGEIVPLECETAEELDAQVEKMLNEDGYAKCDFIIVKVVDYDIEASNYSDAEEEVVEGTDA